MVGGQQTRPTNSRKITQQASQNICNCQSYFVRLDRIQTESRQPKTETADSITPFLKTADVGVCYSVYDLPLYKLCQTCLPLHPLSGSPVGGEQNLHLFLETALDFARSFYVSENSYVGARRQTEYRGLCSACSF